MNLLPKNRIDDLVSRTAEQSRIIELDKDSFKTFEKTKDHLKKENTLEQRKQRSRE